MKAEYSIQEIIQRAENFRWNTKELQNNFEKDRQSFRNLAILHDSVVGFCESNFFQGLSDAEKFEQVFRNIFRTIKRTGWEINLCFNIAPEVFEICKFTTICTFLHTSKRISGESIRNFVLHNSPLDFSNPDSINYRAVSLLNAEMEKLKKSRMRLLSQGQVYIKNQQWNAITKDSAYEWGFYYDLLKEDPDVQRAFKQQKNLYSDIQKALRSKEDEGFENRIQDAYAKFLSKLKKFNYEKYLELQQLIKSRICQNEEYYGINLYRLERRMRPHIITREVKKLTESVSEEDENNFLLKAVCLDNICFSGIYKKLFELPLEETYLYAEVFLQYIERSAVESCLILDELIERGFWKDTWEKLFRDISNELADIVLYDFEKIDLSITEKSQQSFLKILHASVIAKIIAVYKIRKYSQKDC